MICARHHIRIATFLIWFVLSPATFAQSSPHEKPATPAEQAKIKRGEAIFYDRCPLCHFGRAGKSTSGVFTGPNLKGILKSGKPEAVAAVRKQILKGTPHMPGYEYTLKPAEIDDLIAFLRTYN